MPSATSYSESNFASPFLLIPAGLEGFEREILMDTVDNRTRFGMRVLEDGNLGDWNKLPAGWLKIDKIAQSHNAELVGFWLDLQQPLILRRQHKDWPVPHCADSPLTRREIEHFFYEHPGFSELIVWTGLNALFYRQIPNLRGRYDRTLRFSPHPGHSRDEVKEALAKYDKVTSLPGEPYSFEFAAASKRTIKVHLTSFLESRDFVEDKTSTFKLRIGSLNELLATKIETLCQRPALVELIDLYHINEQIPLNWLQILKKIGDRFSPLRLNTALNKLAVALESRCLQVVPFLDPPTANKLIHWLGTLQKANQNVSMGTFFPHRFNKKAARVTA